MTATPDSPTIRRVPALLCFLLSLLAAPATEPAADRSLEAYVITLGPGDEAWEKFGHNMLYFRDDAGLDVAYNWGMFDFDQPHFLWHFVQGRLWYWMEGFPSGIVNLYINQDRTVTLQRLNLSPQQLQKMLAQCRENVREENKFYLYDYFKNNCSTKVRDAIDDAIDGQLKTQATQIKSAATLRSESLRLTTETLWLYTGLDFIYGQPEDRPLTAWSEAFIPGRLHDRLNQITVTENGATRPLVAEERVYHASGRAAVRAEAPHWVIYFVLAGIGIGATCLLPMLCSRGWLQALASVPMLLWILLSAAASFTCLYLWFFTDHAAVRPNENVLQLSPLSWPLLVAVPLALRRRRRAMKIASMLGVACAIASVLGLLGKWLPFMTQGSANIIALALPANLGLAFGLWRISRCVRPLPPLPSLPH